MVSPHVFVSNSCQIYLHHVFVRYSVHITKPHKSVMFASVKETGEDMGTKMIGAEEVAKALDTSKGYASRSSASSTQSLRRRAAW